MNHLLAIFGIMLYVLIRETLFFDIFWWLHR
jgi:hypothetical protein